MEFDNRVCDAYVFDTGVFTIGQWHVGIGGCQKAINSSIYSFFYLISCYTLQIIM